jgi:hypothetical protein
MIKPRRALRRDGHVAFRREARNIYNVFVVKPEGNEHLEVLGLKGRIILKRAFNMA